MRLHWSQNKDWIEHLSLRNEVIGGHIGRANSIHWHSTRGCFFLWWLLECNECSARDWKIMQLLLAKNTGDIISLAALLEGQKQWLQHLSPETTDCSIQSLFWEQCASPVTCQPVSYYLVAYLWSQTLTSFWREMTVSFYRKDAFKSSNGSSSSLFGILLIFYLKYFFLSKIV